MNQSSAKVTLKTGFAKSKLKCRDQYELSAKLDPKTSLFLCLNISIHTHHRLPFSEFKCSGLRRSLTVSNEPETEDKNLKRRERKFKQ
jgi:hypothetical protein